MISKDPLADWLFYWQMRADIAPDTLRLSRAEAHHALRALNDALAHPPANGFDYYNAPRFAYPVFDFQPSDLPLTEKLYHRIYVTGGKGTTYAQEQLLDLVAKTADPSSIPFWTGLLDLTRPRDAFTTRRRKMAVAALAFLAFAHDSPETHEALRSLLEHPNADVRARALYEMNRVHQELKRALPRALLKEVAQIAVRDTVFAPRFQARALLRDHQQTVPLDNPRGVYAFRVKFKHAKALLSRTLELLSRQTLDDLAVAINHSIDWDLDHLYSFFMNGEKYDEAYAFACQYETDHLPWTHEAVIGRLGLTLRHKFLYYFDYGDSHEFEVEVVAIYPNAENVRRPRVVNATGEAPPQYGLY